MVGKDHWFGSGINISPSFDSSGAPNGLWISPKINYGFYLDASDVQVLLPASMKKVSGGYDVTFHLGKVKVISSGTGLVPPIIIVTPPRK